MLIANLKCTIFLLCIEINEKDKPNPLGLGRQLLLKNESYEDLDEIIERFVDDDWEKRNVK